MKHRNVLRVVIHLCRANAVDVSTVKTSQKCCLLSTNTLTSLSVRLRLQYVAALKCS